MWLLPEFPSIFFCKRNSVHASMTHVSDVIIRDGHKCLEHFCTSEGHKYSISTASGLLEDRDYSLMYLKKIESMDLQLTSKVCFRHSFFVSISTIISRYSSCSSVNECTLHACVHAFLLCSWFFPKLEVG